MVCAPGVGGRGALARAGLLVVVTLVPGRAGRPLLLALLGAAPRRLLVNHNFEQAPLKT